MLKYIALSLLFVVSTLAVGRIVGGDRADIRNHPYQVSLQKRFGNTFKHFCGGSILSEKCTITAAHCIRSDPLEDFQIAAGSSQLNDPYAVKVLVGEIIVHGGFNAKTLDNDVALVFPSERLPINYITIAPIALATEAPPPGSWVSVTGWGDLSFRAHAPNNLFQLYLRVMERSLCDKAYSPFNGPDSITEAMMCANFEGVAGKSTCNGDSGGPVEHKKTLAGIVSWGRECGRSGSPSVFADVAQLKIWIRQHVYIP